MPAYSLLYSEVVPVDVFVRPFTAILHIFKRNWSAFGWLTVLDIVELY